MSIQWMDNFQSYGSVGVMVEGTPYQYINGSIVTDPSGTTQVLQVGQSNGNANAGDNGVALPNPATAVGMAFRFYAPQMPTFSGNRMDIMQWRDISNNHLYVLTLETNGSLTIYDGSSATILGTIVPVITTGSWWHIEAMVDYATGNIKVFVEGSQVLNATISVAATLIYNVGWSPRQSLNVFVAEPYMKDFIVYDKSGTINNTAGSIGPVTVYRLNLVSDVSNGWTITGGTTVSGTINATPPVDTQYISAGYGPFPAAAVTKISSLPSNIVAVRGVMTLQRVKKSDGGVASYQADLISGSSTHTGTTQNPGTSFGYQYGVVELDPATGAAWTPIAVNNVEVKLDRTV